MSNLIDITRLGSGGEGSSFLSVQYDVPLLGKVEVGAVFNKDQFAFFGGGAANLIIPALIQDYNEGRLSK